MKAFQLIIVCILACSLIISCEDFTEKDISNQTIEIVCPADTFTTYISSNFFWWDSIEGVDYYQFQIASPDFNTPIKLFIDTCIKDNNCMINFTPGIYEWRVRGVNSAYKTTFSTRSITIDSSLDLSLDNIILRNPKESDTLKSGIYEFRWDVLYKAVHYRFILLKEGDSLKDTLINDHSIITPLINEGSYSWSVKGMNTLTETHYSNRQFYIDTTCPSIRILLEPGNNSIISDTMIKLKWIKSGNAITDFDSIFVYKDFGNNQLVIKAKSNIDSTFIKVPQGKYKWKVRGYDKAGNFGPFSNFWNFELNYK